MLEYKGIKINVADTFLKRLTGLMFKKNIKEGLLFKNCRMIHTFFMFDKIDVVATDKNDNIIKTYKEISPCKIIIAPNKTKNIYELPKKTLK